MQKSDPTLYPIFQYLQNPTNYKGTILITWINAFIFGENGELYYLAPDCVHGLSPVLVFPSSLVERILQISHSELGHASSPKMLAFLQQRYFWFSMSSDVQAFAKRCLTCSLKSQRQTRVPLGAIPIPRYPFEVLSMDTIALPTTPEASKLLTVTDNLTMYTCLVALKDEKAETIMKALTDHVFAHHAYPKAIKSDNSPSFSSAKLAAFFTSLGIKHYKGLPNWAPSDGKIEAVNKKVIRILSRITPDPKDWPRYTGLCQLAINLAPIHKSRYSPFVLHFGRHPLTQADLIMSSPQYPEQLRAEAATNPADREKNYARMLREALIIARETQTENLIRRNAQRGVTPLDLTPGQEVLLRIHKHPSLTVRKLSDAYEPGWRVKTVLSPHAVTIENQTSGKTKRVSTNHLKTFPQYGDMILDAMQTR